MTSPELEPLLRAIAGHRSDGVSIGDWSLLLQDGRRLTLGVKDREVGNPHGPLRVSDGCALAYKLIWSDGLVSRGWLERRQLAGAAVAEALEQARRAAYADPDAAHVLGPAPMPEVAMHDARTATIAAGDTSLIAERLAHVRERVDACGVRTWSASFGAGEGRSRIVTSAGLDARAAGTTVGWHVSINGEVGDGFEGRRPEPSAEFEARLERLLATAARLGQDAAPLSAGVRPVLLDPGVVEEYVLDTLLHSLAGSTVAHGEGHFRKEQFGSGVPVLREDLALWVDPLEPFRRGTYSFTADGLPAARCTFLEAGRLVRPICDLKYARRLGVEPTPSPAATDTLHFTGGSMLSLDEALARASGGVLVLSVLGVHTQDAASGDFSLSAPQTLRIDDGAYAGRLRATISGNLFRVLASPELAFVRFEGEPTPGLLFPCRLDPR